MKSRLNYSKAAPGVYQAMDALDQYVSQSGLERSLVLLTQLRASQVNGCAYCLDSHARELREIGEPNHRIDTLGAWREVPFFTARERAALAWTDAVTRIEGTHVPDDVFEAVRSQFTEKELCDLTLAIATINTWNRLSISARLVPASASSTVTAAAV